MKKLIILLHFTFFIFHSSFSQESCNLRISLLTCAPGDELYSTFGHTALRVQDGTTGTDLVYNYGTFEFSPEFYTKFIMGKLLYYLSVEEYQNFVYQYQYESRSIVEQVLQLDCAEKQRLYQSLNFNAQDENKYYLYDFLYDNCTTRARDMVAKNTSSPLVFKNILPADIPTFRNLIHSYLDAGGKYWSKLGIDLVLGAKLDKKVTNEQAMFLPDYLMVGFESAMTNKPLVAQKETILKMPVPFSTKNFLTPLFIFSLLFLVVALASFFGREKYTKSLHFFDIIFFLIIGLIGFLLLFMWFGTDHKVTKNNFNLLWALPLHAVVAVFIYKRKMWVSKYFKVIFIISLIILPAWFFLPQYMNNGFLPIFLIIILRSWFISKSYAEKRT